MTIQFALPNTFGDFSTTQNEQNSLSLLSGDVSTQLDSIIDFEGFEKYGPAVGSWYAFFGNFLVGASVLTPLPSQSFFREWTSIGWSGNSPLCGLIKGLNGSGTALALFPAFGNALSIRRNLPANYTRVVLGFACMVSLGATSGCGAFLCDNGTGQSFVGIDNGGRVVFNGAATLFTSTSVIQPNTRHYLEVDVFIHNTLGSYRVWLDGKLLASGTGVNTRSGTANNYANSIVVSNGSSGALAVDDMYWADNTNGTFTPLGDCTVKALPVIADSSVQFTPSATIGSWVAQQVTTTNAPGANILILVPATPAINMTANSVGCLPQTTSTAAKYKGVIYSDNAGAPGSLLSSGTEVIGSTTGVNLTLPLVTPQALTGGTQYWVGLITDTNIAFQLSDNFSGYGQSKANTYASGAPAGPLASMTTGQSPWSIWGVCTGAASNYAGLSQAITGPYLFGATTTIPPVSANTAVAYNQSSTASQEDLFSVSALPTTPASIASVKVSVMANKSISGVRTMDIRLKTGSADSPGTNPGIVPITIGSSLSPSWYSSRYDRDPTTGASWDIGGGEQWSSTFAPAKFTISNGGLTATATDLNHTDTIHGSSSNITGKFYFELQYENVSGADLAWGITTSSVNNSQLIGFNSTSLSFRHTRSWLYNNGLTASGMPSGPSNDDWMGFAVDLTNGRIWIRNATTAPGTWYGNNAIGDPVAATNPMTFTPFAAATFMAYTSNQNGINEVVTMKAGASGFVASAPTGYSAWNAHPQTGITGMTIGYKVAT